MSRNTATLRCPFCGELFTQDCLAWKPVCPKCGYLREQPEQPKFVKVED